MLESQPSALWSLCQIFMALEPGRQRKDACCWLSCGCWGELMLQGGGTAPRSVVGTLKAPLLDPTGTSRAEELAACTAARPLSALIRSALLLAGGIGFGRAKGNSGSEADDETQLTFYTEQYRSRRRSKGKNETATHGVNGCKRETNS